MPDLSTLRAGDSVEELFIYSGNCLLGRVGDETDLTDSNGQTLHVGDIVCLYYDDGSVQDPKFTVIADDKYTTWADGKVTSISKSNPFVMGIKSVDYKADDSKWFVQKVKDHSHLIVGEYWPSFGFRVDNFRGEFDNTRKPINSIEAQS